MLSCDKGMNSAFFSSIVTMDETWKQKAIGSMKAHRLTVTEEVSGECWENDGSHVLGQRRRDTYSLRSQEYDSDGWDLWRCVTNEVSSSIAWKTAQKYCSCVLITTTLLLFGRLVFTSFSTTTTLKLFLMLRTHLISQQAIFGCFQHWRTLFVVAHFQVVPLLQQRIFRCSQRTPKEAFAAATQSWRQRCEKCVRLQGDYVEKWLHFQLPRMSNFF